ncbi:hypothetical protein AB0A74_31655 [Saccharothrix sp. NPDC042600]|uniref:hypothetical protein n=1 Tax=Saccharothrix TaxID=2071 RepID=UPI00340BA51D|nr:hypothetical protein GCM10017745_19600 [Saccharothrix mutabilis subsp. capreolus]
MNKWQQGAVTTVLLAEMAVLAMPAIRAGGDPGSGAGQGLALGGRPGILMAAGTILLVTAGAALVTAWLRPQARTWLATFTGAHAAAAGIGWAHGLPLLTLVSGLAAALVPAVVLLPAKRSQ